MIDIERYKSVPVGSLLLLEQNIADRYIAKIADLPSNLNNIILSWETGAYLRGMSRTYAFNTELVPNLALIVLRVAMGEITLAQLASAISTELKVANDKAQAIATDIEKELFAPIMLEYNQSLRSQKAAASPASSAVLQPSSAGAQNVLDLKQQVAQRPLQAPPRPAVPLRPANPAAPLVRPIAPKSVFPPPPSTSSSRPPNVPW